MKLKRLLSTAVAAVMAVASLICFSTSATALTTQTLDLSSDPIVLNNWDTNPSLDVSGIVTTASVPSSGSCYFTISGYATDGSNWPQIKVCDGDWNELYFVKCDSSDNFTLEVPAYGAYSSLIFMGYNATITEVDFNVPTLNILTARGYQEKVATAADTNSASGIVADFSISSWTLSESAKIPASVLSGCRFDGSEVLTFSGCTNIANSWGDEVAMYSSTSWENESKFSIDTSGNGSIVLTAAYKNCDLYFTGATAGLTLANASIVDYGTVDARYIVKIAEDKVADLDSVTLKFRSGASIATAGTSTTCYRSIYDNGSLISEDGYVYVVFTIANTPANFTFDEAIFYGTSGETTERLATMRGSVLS